MCCIVVCFHVRSWIYVDDVLRNVAYKHMIWDNCWDFTCCLFVCCSNIGTTYHICVNARISIPFSWFDFTRCWQIDQLLPLLDCSSSFEMLIDVYWCVFVFTELHVFVNLQDAISFDVLPSNLVYKSITLDQFWDVWDVDWSFMMCDWVSSISQFSHRHSCWWFSFKCCLPIDQFGKCLRCLSFFQIVLIVDDCWCMCIDL